MAGKLLFCLFISCYRRNCGMEIKHDMKLLVCLHSVTGSGYKITAFILIDMFMWGAAGSLRF